ncbi:ABC transporter ATP-binding protein [Phytohabitans rumicis]|uniref:ABC-type quaternary amine transporter n=1 Tax=Phytohabitans rumicis TaxID=1076125 RepID=A0A6V8L4A1_9ACTN|nr:ABC transporter ATP-binding protein [Phytohabitans rumicis]GFJ89778.1 ABC transporter ATP-binding protein [Phytohabitans rumicis]
MIRLAGVSQTFQARSGAVEALRNINLTVSEGEFVAVIGRSGCGKSTLLRLVAGLIAPSSGEVSVGETRVTKPRKDVAMMFQRPALLPWRSVLDNVLLPVEMFGWKRAEHRQRAEQLLDMVGLSEFHKKQPHELSGGMQQRVALCRALIQRPKVMLMDEPFSALDALTREELSGELQRVHMELGATTVFVTHSIDEAVLLADRVLVLSPRPGRLRRIVDVNIPRPRTLGHNAYLEEVARCSAELHELLFAPDGPPPAPPSTPAPRMAREKV